MDKLCNPADGGKGVKEGREDCNFRNYYFFLDCLLQPVDEVKRNSAEYIHKRTTWTQYNMRSIVLMQDLKIFEAQAFVQFKYHYIFRTLSLWGACARAPRRTVPGTGPPTVVHVIMATAGSWWSWKLCCSETRQFKVLVWSLVSLNRPYYVAGFCMLIAVHWK